VFSRARGSDQAVEPMLMIIDHRIGSALLTARRCCGLREIPINRARTSALSWIDRSKKDDNISRVVAFGCRPQFSYPG
jgi:hypothetical protein